MGLGKSRQNTDEIERLSQLATRTLLANCLHSNNFLSCVLPNKNRFLPFLGLPQDYTGNFLINYQITLCYIMTTFSSYLGTSPHVN